MEDYLRKSNNVLLFKDGLGKSKPVSYQLPDPTFAYGKNPKPDDEGTKESMISIIIFTKYSYFKLEFPCSFKRLPQKERLQNLE
jgi:hypothetical protein